ncbi:MAG: hypothetical protein GEU81_15470, partial [Nitriliruptorales bacterium]|nr:hypothetical protein [Nitriliruptorales bacterium]
MARRRGARRRARRLGAGRASGRPDARARPHGSRRPLHPPRLSWARGDARLPRLGGRARWVTSRPRREEQQMADTEAAPLSEETQAVAEYLAGAVDRPLPDEVVTRTTYHVLDTVAAMISGAVLEPGRLAIGYVRSQGGVEEAQVIGADVRTNATLAALANGISAHADETDDSHAPSFSHPGCAVVPAALAVAERHGRSGTDLVRAVAAGYDIGCRITPMLGMSQFSAHGSSLASHAVVSVYGAAAAAAALEGLSPEQVRWVLSYATQQSSGVTT